MNWFGGSKEKNSALLSLSKYILTSSIYCAELLKPNLEEKYGKNSESFHLKYIPVLFEFMYFFIHLTDRLAFSQLDQKKRKKLQNNIHYLVIDAMIEKLFENWTLDFQDGIKNDFITDLNKRELEYGNCSELLLRPEDDITLIKKISSGEKSKSVVGQLIDNISKVITDDINKDVVFEMEILGMIIEIIKKKEIDGLLSEVFKEL